MPIFHHDGCDLHYELIGDGRPVVMTPGGHLGGAVLRTVAGTLAAAADHQVVLWDRRNTGASHVWFGPQPEQEVWADDLAALLRHLDLSPAVLAGGSAGSRVSYLTALRHPDVVSALALWSVSGGPYASQVLGFQNHTPFINAAIRGGMSAVAATEFWSDRIAANPANRDRLLDTPVEDFIAALRAWNVAFYWRPDTPVIAATGAELSAIGVPTLIFAGNDDIHAPEAAATLNARVHGSTLVPSPWSRDEFMDRYVGKSAESVTSLYVRLVPTLLEFLASAPVRGGISDPAQVRSAR